METPRLPTGVQSFRKVRENGLRYVDKTKFAAQLVSGGYSYFLSRPRRFGKSLFVSMLKELFEGNEELFRGLSIHSDWDWSQRSPVIHLDFAAGEYEKEGILETRIMEMLGRIEREHDVPSTSKTVDGRFSELIYGLSKQASGPAVVLIDEYDMPILTTIDDPKAAKMNRNVLQRFFSVLKSEDDNIRFCFVTGVSMFSHAGLFSGGNNLTDISLVPKYSEICGYTESDLDAVFAEDLGELDRGKIRDWYNGYSWLGERRVYNPYGILRTMETGFYRAWWFKTSTPTFLAELIKRSDVPAFNLENLTITDHSLNASEIESVSVESLLFQTGYLTIADYEMIGNVYRYTLDFPNREVRQSYSESLLGTLLPSISSRLDGYKTDLLTLMVGGRLDDIQETLESVFAGIPHQWHTTSKAANYETYFASVVYGLFVGAGLDVRVEDSTSEGRIDLAVVESTSIYLFEFKVVNGSSAGDAIRQLRKKNYAKKYRRYGRPIHLVGVEFSKESKNVVVFQPELA